MVFRNREESLKAGKATHFKPGNQMAKGCTTSGHPVYWTEDKIDEEKVALSEWIEEPANYFFTNYLNRRKISAQTVEWISNLDAEYKELVRLAKSFQEERLVEKGINRKGDGNFIKFVLQNKAGWKDQQHVDMSVNPMNDILTKIANSPIDVTPLIEP